MADDALEALEMAIASTSSSGIPTGKADELDAQLAGLDAILSSLVTEEEDEEEKRREAAAAAVREAAAAAAAKEEAKRAALLQERIKQEQLRDQQLREERAMVRATQEAARARAMQILRQREEAAKKAAEIERMRQDMVKAAEEEAALEEQRLREAMERAEREAQKATATESRTGASAVSPTSPSSGTELHPQLQAINEAERRRLEQERRDAEYRKELQERKRAESAARTQAEAVPKATSLDPIPAAASAIPAAALHTSTSLPTTTLVPLQTPVAARTSPSRGYTQSVPSSASVPLHSLVDRAEQQRRRDREFADTLRQLRDDIGLASGASTLPKWFALKCTNCGANDVTFNISRGYCICENCDADALNGPFGQLYQLCWEGTEWSGRAAELLAGSLLDKGTPMHQLTSALQTKAIVGQIACRTCNSVDTSINLQRAFFKCEKCGSDDNHSAASPDAATNVPAPTPAPAAAPEKPASGHESFVHRSPAELFAAARAGDKAKIEDMLSCGMDVNCKDETGYTALHWAVAMLHYSAVRTLVEHRADVNVANGKGFTPLHLAQGRGDEKLSKWLMKHGAAKSPKPKQATAIKPTGGADHALSKKELKGSSVKKNTWRKTGAGRKSSKMGKVQDDDSKSPREPAAKKPYESLETPQRIMRVWAGGGYKKMTIDNSMTASDLCEKMAAKLGALTIKDDLAVYEVKRGKRAKACADGELPWDRMQAWPREYVVDVVDDYKDEKYRILIDVKKGAPKANKEKWKTIAV